MGFFSDLFDTGGLSQVSNQTGGQQKLTGPLIRGAGVAAGKAESQKTLGDRPAFKPFGGPTRQIAPNQTQANLFGRANKLSQGGGGPAPGSPGSPSGGNENLQNAKKTLAAPFAMAEVINKSSASVVSKLFRIMNGEQGVA